MPVKTFAVLGGLVATALLGPLPALLGAPALWHVTALAAVAATVAWWGRVQIDRDHALVEIPTSTRTQWKWAYTVAVGLHLAWALTATAMPALTAALTLLALSAGEQLTAALWERHAVRLDPPPPPTPAPLPVVYEAEIVDDQVDAPLTADDLGSALLAAAGYGHYELVPGSALELPAGISWQFVRPSPLALAQKALRQARIEAKARGENPNLVSAPTPPKVPNLQVEDGPLLAATFETLTGVPMQNDWVEVRHEKRVGHVTVTCVTRDVAAEAIPYDIAQAQDPETINVGLTRRADPLGLRTRLHWQIVGATGSGKTGLEWQFMAHALTHGHLIVLGTTKIWPLVEEWLDNLPAGQRLPFRVAAGLDDCLSMLVAVLGLMHHRLSRPAVERANLPLVRVVVTEAAAVLPDRSRTILWRGAQRSAGQLVGELIRTGTEAEVFALLSAQDYDHDYWGTEANSVKNNTGTVLVRSRSADERRRAFGDAYYHWPSHSHPGELYAAETGEVPVSGKAAYLQQTSRRRLHDGATAADLAPALARGAREFTPEEIAAAGRWFAGLPTVMTPEHRDYLRGTSPTLQVGTTGGETGQDRTQDNSAQRRADDAFAAIRSRVAARVPALASAPKADPATTTVPTAPATTPQPVASPTPSSPRDPMPTRLVALVTAAGTLSRLDALAALTAEGYPTSESTLDNTLSRLVASGRLTRTATAGVYAPPAP